MENYIIVVAGTPGTGKSSFIRVASRLLGCSGVDSGSLFIREGSVYPDETGRGGWVVDVGSARRVVRGFAGGLEGCALVGTSYPAIWLEEAEEHVAAVALLRTHPRELRARLEGRGWGRAKVLENVVAEALNVVAEEVVEWGHSTIEVDTTGRTPEGSVEEFLRKLYSWEPGVGIDWLSVDPGLFEYVSRMLSELDLHKGGAGVGW